MKAFHKQKLDDIFNEWGKNFTIIAPLEEEEIRFKKWEEGKRVNLTKNSTVPPKEVFFPQTEELYRFQLDGVDLQINEMDQKVEPFILFGIRPCDLKSLEMLDDVFLTKGFVDSYYRTKRELGVLVAYLCPEPERTCFCTSMDVDYRKAPGADLVVMDDGEYLGLEAQTTKGEELLKAIESLLEEKSVSLPEPVKQQLEVDTEGLAEKLAGMFEHPYWDYVHEKCLGCGICTYVCPTCHCFDINSHNRGKKGFKTRCWDSCMFPDYTQMAGGHNPRPTRKERFRNRFLHKLQYFPERYDKVGCVGCGRCLKMCPVNVDITAIISELKEAAVNGR